MEALISIKTKHGWTGVGVEIEMPRVKKKEPVKRIAPVLTPSYKPLAKDRIYVIGIPDRHGVIMNVGPEVSEVRWDDRSSQTYIINEWLQPVGNNK